MCCVLFFVVLLCGSGQASISGNFDQEQVDSDFCNCGSRLACQSFRPSCSGVLQYLSLPVAADGSVNLSFFNGEIDPWNYNPALAICNHTFTPAVLSDPCSYDDPQWQNITLIPGFSVMADQAYTVVWGPGTASAVGYCFHSADSYLRGQASEIGGSFPSSDYLFRIGFSIGDFDQEQVDSVGCYCTSLPVGQSFRPSHSGVLQYLSLPAAADGSVELFFFNGEIDPWNYNPALAIYNHTFTPAVLSDPCAEVYPQWQNITLTPGFSVVADQAYTVVWGLGTASVVGACWTIEDAYLRGQSFEIGGNFSSSDYLFRIGFPAGSSSLSPFPSPSPNPNGNQDIHPSPSPIPESHLFLAQAQNPTKAQRSPSPNCNPAPNHNPTTHSPWGSANNTQSLAKPQPQPQPLAKPQSQSQPLAKPQPQPQPLAKPQPQPQPLAKPQPQPQPLAKPQPQPQPLAKPQPQAKLNSQPQPQRSL